MEEFIRKKWICPVCGYVYEGENPPEKCPTRKVDGKRFTDMAEDTVLAAGHESGIYARTVKNNADISEEDKNKKPFH